MALGLADFAFFPIPSDQPGSTIAALLLEHLERTGQSQHFPGLGRPDAFGFLAVCGEQAVGHVSLLDVPIEFPTLPPLDFFDPQAPAWRDCAGSSLREGFVQTFFVEEAFRRRGVGKALQRLAIQECSIRGLSQMRSWSAQDARENYRLKLDLGFGVVPGSYYSARAGKWSRGCWFVWPLGRDDA